MRQLFIAGNVAYSSAATDTKKLDKLENGAIGIFDSTGKLVSAALTTLKDYVTIALGRKDKPHLIMDEVNLASLSVVKGEYSAATKFTAQMTIPEPVVGKDYTIILVKEGCVFNERSNWTFTERAVEGDTAETIANRIVKMAEANKVNNGVGASNAAGVITFTAAKAGVGYKVIGADAMIAVKPASVTEGVAAYGDKAYVQNLASEAAAGKGFNYTSRDGDTDIYPGYPEEVAADSYTIYTLRFANPRKSKTRDEVVNQILQIAVPTGAGQIATLDTIFGTAAE